MSLSNDRAPLDLFRETLGCGTMRRAGNGGWYWEVNSLPDQGERIVPFFERFPLVGEKATDFALWSRAIALLRQLVVSGPDRHQVLALRERMNRGGKRKYRMDEILRGHTPTSSGSTDGMRWSDLTGDRESWSEPK